MRHRQCLRCLQPDTPGTRLLQALVEQRRRLVDEKTRQKLRLIDCLKLYFPQLLRWFDDVDTPLVADLLQRWPSLPQLQRARPDTLRKFFHHHNCRQEERIQQRITAIYDAMPLTEDSAVVEGGSLQAQALMALLSTLRSQIAIFQKRIDEVTAAHPNASVFASLPGAGEVFIPRLIVAFGTQPQRYQNAYQMQCFSGIAPVTEASGRSRWVHMRRACPRFLRQTFHEFASHSIRFSEWARAFYDNQIAKRKSHHTAIRALANRWIRILFRCWKDHQPYDEQIYLQSLHKRNSPLGTAFQWQSVGGFQKLSKRPA